MAGVASKNLFDLLGNTSDDDPDKIPAPINTPVEKPLARKGKRDAVADAAPANVPATTSAPRGGRGGGRGGRYSGNERAFRDRDAGRDSNKTRSTDESGRGPRGPRGGRGGARPRPYDDRHSKGVGAGPNDHAKQAAHGWGDDTGTGEWKDEQAGEQIAVEESKQGFDANVDKPVNAEGETPGADTQEPEPEPEPEDKTKSYADYLAELAEKKLQLGGTLAARQANEGSGQKLPEGKELARDGDAEYFTGSGGKARRERERKEKNVFVLDHDIQARERESGSRGGRGGRGRGRGDAFRGERGDRGRGGRGRGEGRGDYRGGRGGRGGAAINVGDTSAFPSLGA